MAPATGGVPGAASLALRRLLSGPAVAGRVLGAFPTAVHIHVGGSVVAVVTHDGLRLPNAVALGAASAATPLASVRAGARASVGGGGVGAGPVRVQACRWWDPRPRLGGVDPVVLGVNAADAGRRLAHRFPDETRDRKWTQTGSTAPQAAHGRRGSPPDSAVVRSGVTALEAALRAGDTDAAVAGAGDLLGLGSGLTPAGDDVLAGTLAGLRVFGGSLAGGSDRVALTLADRIAAAVAVPGRTTLLSAALLGHAAAGEVAAPVARACRALAGRHPLGPAVASLCEVGHSSGRWLLYGLVLAARRAAGSNARSG